MTGDPAVSRRVMTRDEIDATFDAFVRAFRTRDREALFAIWTPDLQVWHSADRRVTRNQRINLGLSLALTALIALCVLAD